MKTASLNIITIQYEPDTSLPGEPTRIRVFESNWTGDTWFDMNETDRILEHVYALAQESHYNDEAVDFAGDVWFQHMVRDYVEEQEAKLAQLTQMGEV